MGHTKRKRLNKIAKLIERDGCYCHYCNKPAESPNSFTLDHIKPRIRGGNNSLENLVLACRSCNLLKSDVPYELFKEKLSELGRKNYRKWQKELNSSKAQQLKKIRDEIGISEEEFRKIKRIFSYETNLALVLIENQSFPNTYLDTIPSMLL